MSKLIHINNEYAEWVKSLSLRFRQSQVKAAVKVNSEMLKFYWSLGKDIVERDMENKYGSSSVTTNTSASIWRLLPNFLVWNNCLHLHGRDTALPRT